MRLQQSNNFLVRIHAIACLKAVWDLGENFDELKEKLVAKYPFIERHVAFAQNQAASGNMGRNVDRVMGNVLFQKFTTADLSTRMIFRSLAIFLGGKPETLMAIKSIEKINSSHIMFKNRENLPTEDMFQKVDQSEKFVLPTGSEIFATQQKITPWLSGELETQQTKSGKST